VGSPPQSSGNFIGVGLVDRFELEGPCLSDCVPDTGCESLSVCLCPLHRAYRLLTQKLKICTKTKIVLNAFQGRSN